MPWEVGIERLTVRDLFFHPVYQISLLVSSWFMMTTIAGKDTVYFSKALYISTYLLLVPLLFYAFSLRIFNGLIVLRIVPLLVLTVFQWVVVWESSRSVQSFGDVLPVVLIIVVGL